MKKGFTLVELLAVLVLLGLVSVIAFPLILEAVDRSNKNISKNKIELMYQGADRYIKDNGNAYPKIEGNTFCIKADVLYNEKYIDFEDYEEEIEHSIRAVVNADGKLVFSYIESSDCQEVGVIAGNLGEIKMDVTPVGYAYEKEVAIQFPIDTNDYTYTYSVDGGETWTTFKNEKGDGLLKYTFEENGYIIARVKKIGETAYRTMSATVSQIDRNPIGTVLLYAGNKVPTGYFPADGSEKSKKAYEKLADAIGSMYGDSSNPTVTFRLPNLSGNVIVGVDSSQSEFDSLGLSGQGEKTVVLQESNLPKHTHIQEAHTHIQDPHNHDQEPHNHTQQSHTHTQKNHYHDGNGWTYLKATGETVMSSETVGEISDPSSGYHRMAQVASSGGGWGNYKTLPAATATNNATTAENIANNGVATDGTKINQLTTAKNLETTAKNKETGESKAHNNLQPYITLQYIIKYQ